MIRLIYSDAAERDLTEIAANIAFDKAVAASRFVEGLRDHACCLKRFRSWAGRVPTFIQTSGRSHTGRIRFTIVAMQIEVRLKSCGFGMADARCRQRLTCCGDAHFSISLF